jgi:hypothetical protein
MTFPILSPSHDDFAFFVHELHREGGGDGGTGVGGGGAGGFGGDGGTGEGGLGGDGGTGAGGVGVGVGPPFPMIVAEAIALFSLPVPSLRRVKRCQGNAIFRGAAWMVTVPLELQVPLKGTETVGCLSEACEGYAAFLEE